MSKLITNNFNFNRCLLANADKLNLCSIQSCCIQDKIISIRKNMAISEKILTEINDRFLAIYVTNCFLVVNDLLLFYRTNNSADNTINPYVNSLVLQTQLLVAALSELKLVQIYYPITSPEWIYIVQKFLSRILSTIVSIVSKSFTLELQTQTGANRIILLPCIKCQIERNHLRNNINLLEELVTNATNVISINSLVVLISNLNLMATMINCQCNTIINNLVKVINNQLQLFLILIPMIPLLSDSIDTSLAEIILDTMEFIVEPVQSLQILIAQFANVRIRS